MHAAAMRSGDVTVLYGDVIWVNLPPYGGSAPGGRRPALVLQQDRFNRSQIQTVVMAAITSNLKLAAAPGNVRLRRGEAGLSKPSVVNVSQLMAVDRDLLDAKIGHFRRPFGRSMARRALALGTAHSGARASVPERITRAEHEAPLTEECGFGDEIQNGADGKAPAEPDCVVVAIAPDDVGAVDVPVDGAAEDSTDHVRVPDSGEGSTEYQSEPVVLRRQARAYSGRALGVRERDSDRERRREENRSAAA